jgi:hypothetical protein
LVTFTTLPTPPTFSGTYTQNFTGFTNLATLPVGWTALSSAGVNNYVGEFSSGSSTGGFYGTTNTPGVLGYLHTSSTGTVTNKLTLINGTGGELTSLYVSYKGRVEATNNTRIPIMTVKLNGATVAELEYSTASGVDELKSTHVTGLSIADGAQFTVTWENDRGLSSGNSRRIGLTDVRVSTSAPNFTPTDIALSANSIPENNVIGESVGTLSSTDPDSSDTHTYSLVSGTGDTDNSSFTIDGSTLKAGVAFDFETKSSYSIRVRTTDLGNNTFEKVFTISVTDVNENPVDTTPPVITLNGDNPLTVLWGLTWIDEYSAFDAGDNAAVTVNRSNPVDTKVPGSYAVIYTASDSQGNSATNTRIVNVRFAGGGTNRGPDGLPDAVRFAMGADGTNAIDRALLPTTQVSGNSLVMNYHARPGSSPVNMVPVVSTELGNSWSTAGITVTTNGTTNANGVTLEKRQATVPTTDGTRKFLRLRATTSQ